MNIPSRRNADKALKDALAADLTHGMKRPSTACPGLA